MSAFSSCCESFKALSRGAAKAAAARLRQLGLGPVYHDWTTRAQICERCPLRVVQRGVSYCGNPFLRQIQRHADEGCGCPTREKAQSPSEHCPLDEHHRPAEIIAGRCGCKWCQVRYRTVVAPTS